MVVTEKNNGESARDYAFRTLKENIISMELKPGSLISENEIALELGLSRTPVREAIIDLSKAAIIEAIPQRGSYVSLIDDELVEESRFLRQVLDIAVIEEACDKRTDEGIALLEENVQLQEFYAEKKQLDKVFDLDNEFHASIYTIAKKNRIFEMRSTMMIHFNRVRSLSVETVKDLKIVGDHRGMLEAIKAKDKEKAVELVVKHLNRYHMDEDLIRKEHPEYFK